MPMTGEEKRRILKEQYKKELLERRAFIEKAKALRKMQRINKAITDMESAMHDDSDEWIDILNQESALSEAKMEMIMEEAGVAEEQNKLDEIQMQAEMAKKSAEDLVRQMKIELGLLEDTPKEEEGKEKKEEESTPSTETSGDVSKETADKKSSKDTKDPPKDKTMGDF